MSLRNIKLITFDVTNTLLKFRMPPWQFYTVIAKDYGYKGTENEVKMKLKDNFEVMWEKHPNFGKTSIAWEQWWTEVVRMTLVDNLPANADINCIANKLINEFKTDKCWCVAQGGDILLSHLKKQNISLGVISNFDPRLNDILQNVGLFKYFDFVLTSYEIGYSKPDERIFKRAIEMCKHDLKPAEALHIGDDYDRDYQGARAAGWHAVLINSKITTETPPAPQHVFNSLEDLYATIGQDKLSL
ncbi:rhythmically expressed gene 2 [Anticarsia gemmatalis]|uniref:rhythmically expressed gene 2 n=1 Tax=Anticarsia gemmatalis TaxID=129554 RepID=UPI003F771381